MSLIEQKTTLTLKDEYGEYSVSVSKTCMQIHGIVDLLLKPLLIASTFDIELVNNYFGGDDE